MPQRMLFAAACLWAANAWAGLTDVETKWLRAGLPVLEYAKGQGLPLDVVVQPQAQAGAAPLAMGFVDGRCKLVLSMRGNPQAEAPLAGVPPALEPMVIEAITAHEVAHCWRNVQGAWHALPAGFVGDSTQAPALDPERAHQWREMRATRREEGLADLAGLAWTAERHPERYADVHAWLARVRDDQPVPGSHHDTRAWVRLAAERGAFSGRGTPFEQAHALWQRGLLHDD